MLDRAIGILGIALALIFGLWSLAPEGWPKMPPWLTLLGIGVGILLMGLATGMIISDHRNKSEDPDANKFVFHDNPPHIVMSKKTFVNERVMLDGRAYRDCIFENVTLVFNGTEPFEMSGSKFNGKTQVTTDNPAITGVLALMRGIGMINQVEFRNESGSRIELPKMGLPVGK